MNSVFTPKTPLRDRGYLFVYSLHVLTCLMLTLVGENLVHTTPQAQASATAEQWKVEFDRARKRSQTQTLQEMIDRAPDLAQIWFYGEIFSLASSSLPVSKRAELLATLNLIAKRLSEQGEHRPLLLLEETKRDSFTQISSSVNQLQDRLFAQASELASFESRVKVCMELIGQDIIIESTYHALLYRALLRTGAVGYMPNQNEERAYLIASLPLAECEILFQGQTTRWTVLKRYVGQNGDPKGQSSAISNLFLGGTLLEQKLQNLWELWEKKSWEEASKVMRSVIDIIGYKSTQSSKLALATLYINESFLLAKRGQLDASTQLLERVIDRFVDIEQRSLPPLLRLSLASLFTESSKWDQVNIQLELLLEQTQIFETSRNAQQRAVELTTQLVKAIENLHGARRNSEAINLFKVTLKLFSVITDERYADLLLPTKLRKRSLLDKQLARASFYALTSRVYEETGQLDKARSQLDEARKSHPQPEAARSLLLAWDLEQARLILAGGEPRQALDQLLPLSEVLYRERRRSILASTAGVISEAFHMLGRDRVSFTYANYGLLLLGGLRDLKGTEKLHAHLHAKASSALTALGYEPQALERLNKSLSLSDLTSRRFQLVWLHTRKGEYEHALNALDQASSLPLQKQIIRGCIFARQGLYQEALDALQAYALTNAARSSIEGRLCLIYAHIMSGNKSDIEYVERPLDALQRDVKDPRYTWRRLAFKAIRLAKRKRGQESWDTAMHAYEEWRALSAELPERGWHQEVPVFALPDSPLVALKVAFDAIKNTPLKSPEQAWDIIAKGRWLDTVNYPLPTRRKVVSALLGDSLNTQLKDELQSISLISAQLSTNAPNLELSQKFEARQLKLSERPAYAKLREALSARAQIPTPVKEALNLVFFTSGAQVYRLTLTAEGPQDLKRLGPTKRLIPRLKRWNQALKKTPETLVPPKNIRRKKLLIRDPHYALWRESYQLARELLPLKEVKVAIGDERVKAVVVWSDLPIDTAWGALVLEAPERRTDGGAPRFLAGLTPVFHGLTSRLVSASVQGTPESKVGRLSMARPRDCETQRDRCFSKLNPVMGKIPALTVADHISESITSARGILWSLPLNLNSYVQWTAQGLKRSPRLPQTPQSASAEWVHFEHSTLEAHRLKYPLLTLSELGVQSFSWSRWNVENENLIRPLITSFSRGLSVAVADRFNQQEMLNAQVDLSVGGTPRFHPYFWAHTYFVHTPTLIERALSEMYARPQSARVEKVQPQASTTPVKPTQSGQPKAQATPVRQAGDSGASPTSEAPKSASRAPKVTPESQGVKPRQPITTDPQVKQRSEDGELDDTRPNKPDEPNKSIEPDDEQAVDSDEPSEDLPDEPDGSGEEPSDEPSDEPSEPSDELNDRPDESDELDDESPEDNEPDAESGDLMEPSFD